MHLWLLGTKVLVDLVGQLVHCWIDPGSRLLLLLLKLTEGT